MYQPLISLIASAISYRPSTGVFGACTNIRRLARKPSFLNSCRWQPQLLPNRCLSSEYARRRAHSVFRAQHILLLSTLRTRSSKASGLHSYSPVDRIHLSLLFLRFSIVIHLDLTILYWNIGRTDRKRSGYW